MRITIKGRDIELVYSIRALMIYENIEGHSFQPKGLTETITLLYCIVLASSKDYSISFDDVIDEIDRTPSLLTDFTAWLASTFDNQNKLKKE